MAMTMPIPALALLAAGIFLCRPWLEARRLSGSMAVCLGLAIGATWPDPAGAAGIPVHAEPFIALAAGWLVLAAAEPWSLSTLRRLRPIRLIAGAGVAALGTAGLALWASGATTVGLPAVLVLTACAAGSVDPETVRDLLARNRRPETRDRLAPAAASVALGAALLATGIAIPLHHPDASIFSAALHALLTVGSGVAIGIAAAGAMRFAGGKGLTQSVIAAAALCGWGVARWIDMSPIALLFVAGVVLANDARSRDLAATVMAEMARPLSAVLLVLAGVLAPMGPALRSGWPFWGMVLAIALARPILWRLVTSGGLRPREAFVLSPLALAVAVLPLLTPGWTAPAAWLPAAVPLALVMAEALWLVAARWATSS